MYLNFCYLAKGFLEVLLSFIIKDKFKNNKAITSIMKEGQVRVYIIDKPSFLSCGRAYVTNADNNIIVHDDNCDNGPLKLMFQKDRDMPYTLAPYPVHFHNWKALIRKGTNVYPSCDVDTPGGYSPAKDDIPKILETFLLSQEELKTYVGIVRTQARDYSARLAADLKKVDKKYGARKKKLEAQIRAEKAEARKRHTAPDLAEMVLKYSKRDQ